jgi:hypothetical protein
MIIPQTRGRYPERYRRGNNNNNTRIEYYNNKLCITHSELTDGIASKPLIDKWTISGNVERVRRAHRSQTALYAVDSLPLKYRTEVYRRHPDARQKAVLKPFIDTIDPDGAALNFYEETYLLPDGRHLSREKVTEYANNAAILNAFQSLIERAEIERMKVGDHHLSRSEFWANAARALPGLSDRFPNTLPLHPRRLQEKFNQYRREGYAALVTGKYGTRNAAKVDDETKESLLVGLIANARNLDNAYIAMQYNEIAKRQKWDTISSSAVASWRKKHDLLTAASRLGSAEFRNKRTMQVKRSRPTLPLLYWTVDGWTAELYYQDVKERESGSVTTYSNRLTIVVVLDPCLDYPVGYAIGERETPALITAALRDAANHTAALLGRRYRANQLQTDNYGRGHLAPVYKVSGEIYTPARAHNAKSKVIEPYFNMLNRKYCRPCMNWSGFGITSNKELQPNSEYLNAYRKEFPDAKGARARLSRSWKRSELASASSTSPCSPGYRRSAASRSPTSSTS